MNNKIFIIEDITINADTQREESTGIAVWVANKIEYKNNKVLVLQEKDFNIGIIEDCACMLNGIKRMYRNEDVISGHLFYICDGLKTLGNRDNKIENVQMKSNDGIWNVIKKVIGVK